MPDIEFVMNADHAEAINGKLYMHGAGWTDHFQPPGPNGQPGISHMGIAVSVIIGWNETNRRFPLTLTLMHEDGAALTQVNAQIEAGRPPGVPNGSEFRSVLAISAEIVFRKTGTYRLEAEIAGKSKSASFRVHPPGARPGMPGISSIPAP